VDASCVWRWVQAYGPEIDERCRPHLKSTNKSYRVDETYVNRNEAILSEWKPKLWVAGDLQVKRPLRRW
jgi:transposase, IS6 family